jgi:hypothetical protein
MNCWLGNRHKIAKVVKMNTFSLLWRIGWTIWHDTTSMNNLYLWFNCIIPPISQCFVSSLEIQELSLKEGTVENLESNYAISMVGHQRTNPSSIWTPSLQILIGFACIFLPRFLFFYIYFFPLSSVFLIRKSTYISAS